MAGEKLVLQVIVGSTRPGRVGLAVAQWFYGRAFGHDAFAVELVDLVDVGLPLLDEPVHPIRREYQHEHTRRWSAIVSRADAFVFVIPEYNFSLNGATKNAIDYLHFEWRYKPYGIVCYGGAARGLRAAQTLKPILASLKMTLCGDVAIHLATTPVSDGVFNGDEALERASTVLLDELAVFAPLLKTLRSSP